MNKLRKKGVRVEPIAIQGRKIARTFWGDAWCRHLERFSDFANRLPRGRTYVRNGLVCHLAIGKGKIEAMVSGSTLYHVNIRITALSAAKWKNVREHCAGQIGSMLELLQGKLSSQVMGIVTDPVTGLFPRPADIEMNCDCPDWAGMCKHVAAVLYGVGARLDERPELLFALRKVDHEELISAELDLQSATRGSGKRRRLAEQNLSSIFGIDLEDATSPARKKARRKTVRRRGQATTAARKSSSRSVHAAASKRAAVAAKKKAYVPTAASITRLRKRCAMTRSQFAAVLGVSPQTVANWENHRGGRLKLQQRSLKALNRAWLRN
jgi:uncharacterized Zn finger protein